MPESVYKIIELVGTSSLSWDDAAKKGCGNSQYNSSGFKSWRDYQAGHDY